MHKFNLRSTEQKECGNDFMDGLVGRMLATLF